jgi:hypothetical protein
MSLNPLLAHLDRFNRACPMCRQPAEPVPCAGPQRKFLVVPTTSLSPDRAARIRAQFAHWQREGGAVVFDEPVRVYTEVDGRWEVLTQGASPPEACAP